jgi:flagella basal body P-ring formation protein FlgA
VTTDVVTVADVAELRGFSTEDADRFGRTVVHAAPREGGEILVRHGDIRSALAEVDANLATLRIFGSSRCRVTRPRMARTEPPPPARTQPIRKHPVERVEPKVEEDPIAPGSLESAMRRFISARAAGMADGLEIRFSPANRRDLQLSDPEFQFKIKPQDKQAVGLLTFEVDVIRDGRVERTAPIVAEVWLLKDVVVARRAINHGQEIEGRDVKLERRQFSDVGAIGLTDLAAAIGQQSTAFVKSGDMLRAKWLEAKPIVARGDRVTIWSRCGGLVIKTTGRAQQAGALGAMIDVRRDGSKRRQDLIEAVVTGPGTVSLMDTRQVARR